MTVTFDGEKIYGIVIITESGTAMVFQELVKDKAVRETHVETLSEGIAIDNYGDEDKKLSHTFMKSETIREYTIFNQATEEVKKWIEETGKDARHGGHLSA